MNEETLLQREEKQELFYRLVDLTERGKIHWECVEYIPISFMDKDMFLYELENHEYSYTGTVEDALDSLGLSFEDVASDPRLARGLDLAEQEILEQQQTMGM